jgi:hypothetical protein
VLINLAFYLQCDIEPDALAASLRDAQQAFEAETMEVPNLLATPCGLALMKQKGSIEALMKISGKNFRRAREAEGFRDI